MAEPDSVVMLDSAVASLGKRDNLVKAVDRLAKVDLVAVDLVAGSLAKVVLVVGNLVRVGLVVVDLAEDNLARAVLVVAVSAAKKVSLVTEELGYSNFYLDS